jgi:hypothetical protein
MDLHFYDIVCHDTTRHDKNLFMYMPMSQIGFVTHSQLLEGLKCEYKWKTAEEGGVGARSLAHNTWGVKGRVGAPGWD